MDIALCFWFLSEHLFGKWVRVLNSDTHIFDQRLYHAQESVLYHTRRNNFQIYRGCTKRLGLGLIDTTVYMLNLDALEPAHWRPSLHIGTTPVMLKIAKVVPRGLCPCWGCIYSIGPQHEQLPRNAPEVPSKLYKQVNKASKALYPLLTAV